MAPQKPKLPVDSIHIDLKPPEPTSYRDAYIADVMRHGLGTGGVDPLHPTVCAGIYLDLDKWELIEKTFVLATPATAVAAPAARSTAAAGFSHGGGRSFSSSTAPTGAWNISMAGLREVPPVHMAFEGAQLETSLPGPPANYRTDDEYFVPERRLDSRERRLDKRERTPRLYTGRLDRSPAPTGRQSFYRYSARLALFPDNSHDPVSALADGHPQPAFYDLELDTGGLADTWVFSTLLWESFKRIANLNFTDAVLRASYAEKKKMPYPKYKEAEADWSTLVYGIKGTNIVLVKSGLCGIAFQHWDPPLKISNFTIGVVYGASDSEILSKFDGLLGLGRGAKAQSRVNQKGRYGPGMTLPEVAWRRGLIKKREFWIYITDPTWDKYLDDFMCLGAYRNPFSKRIPTWLDLECDPNSPAWMVTLSKITVYDTADSRRPRRNVLEHDFQNLDVLVDSGCSQTYLPSAFVTKAQNMFKTEYSVPSGSASYDCPKSLVVCFSFRSGGGQRVTEAQAVRFFISPNYVDADHPALALKEADRAIFGLNFFRSFIVGFRDDATRPILTIGKHRTVPDDREPRLACRKPPDQTQEAGASTQTQAASDTTRGAPAPPPTRETGGRGNSGSSRLRKTSVSTPAKDARGGGKATEDRPGNRRAHSEQVEFPRYRAPLPGEDEGQGSSRYPLGTNVRAQQESTYGRRTGRHPSESYMPAAPQQFQQPANAGGAGRNVPPAQRTRGNSLSYGAPSAGLPPAQPARVSQQQWTQPGAMYPAAGAPLMRTTSQPLAPAAQPLAPSAAARRRPPALPVPVPSPVPPPRQPRPRTTSLTTGIKNFLFGKKSDKR